MTKTSYSSTTVVLTITSMVYLCVQISEVISTRTSHIFVISVRGWRCLYNQCISCVTADILPCIFCGKALTTTNVPNELAAHSSHDPRAKPFRPWDIYCMALLGELHQSFQSSRKNFPRGHSQYCNKRTGVRG